MLSRLLLLVALSCCAGKELTERYISVRIRSGSCDVTSPSYGAVGDGTHDDSKPIQKALDDSACGTVILPPKTFLIEKGIQFSHSNTELHIASGGTLLVSNTNITGWPRDVHVISNKDKLDNLAITGQGTVDGQGEKWWKLEEKDKGIFRPRLVSMHGAKQVLLTDTTYVNSPNHVLEMYSDNTEITRVKVLAPPSTGDTHGKQHSHNTDAVDVHGQPFYVHNVYFNTGDDNIAQHANDTIVEDSYFGTGHGASIGSLCNNYLTNITFRNITFNGTTAGARIKSHPSCGGHVWDVVYENLTMIDVRDPITITQYYSDPGNRTPSTYLFENIQFKNIHISRTSSASSNPAISLDCDTHFDGKANCHDFKFEHIHVDTGAGAKKMVCNGVLGSASDVTGYELCPAIHGSDYSPQVLQI